MARHKVITIDDDPMTRKLVTAALAKEDYEVFSACDGEEGLACIREIGPDAVILDVRMPKMDGHEVLVALQQDESTKDIPVIMLTSLDAEEDIEKGISLGASHYLIKPVQRDLLIKCLNAVLGL